MFILEARNLCKHYRAGEVRAVHNVSLGVPAGSFTLLTGPSGSGKTTLLALLGCLERPTSGQVLFQDRDLHRYSDTALARLRRRFGFVFQDFALLPGLAVWENITYPLIPRGMKRSARLDLARALLQRVDLPHKLTARPRELSGGEQQRVALARALAGEPEVLLADEPTSNLDDRAGAAVIALLRQAHGEGKTIVISSHDPRLRTAATQVYQMEAGQLKTMSG